MTWRDKDKMDKDNSEPHFFGTHQQNLKQKYCISDHLRWQAKNIKKLSLTMAYPTWEQQHSIGSIGTLQNLTILQAHTSNKHGTSEYLGGNQEIIGNLIEMYLIILPQTHLTAGFLRGESWVDRLHRLTSATLWGLGTSIFASLQIHAPRLTFTTLKASRI